MQCPLGKVHGGQVLFGNENCYRQWLLNWHLMLSGCIAGEPSECSDTDSGRKKSSDIKNVVRTLFDNVFFRVNGLFDIRALELDL